MKVDTGLPTKDDTLKTTVGVLGRLYNLILTK